MAAVVSEPPDSAEVPGEALRRAERDARRMRELVACHTHVHELIGRDAPLAESLGALALGVEGYEPSVMASVVLLNPESNTLHPGAGPSLPPEYLTALDGVVIGPNIGSCGSAAWHGELVVTEDIALDPRWATVREFTLGCGLRHAWSLPIMGADGGVLGTFALYGREPRRPEPEQLELMQGGARLAGIAIERHRSTERLVRDAGTDALSGLPNRRVIFERLGAALTRSGEGSTTAVLFVDLDGLKTINDSLGHDRADQMIQEVAARLRATLRTDDFVGRFGGDEFIVIAAGLDDRSAAGELAERLREAIRQPLTSLDHAMVTASVGVALVTGEDEVSADEAIRQADRAMYAAKRAGGDGCHFFGGDAPAPTSRRLLTARALRGAERRGEMRIVFQPVFDLGGTAMTGVEALLRWNHPELGEVSPGEFIPVAEDTGAIVPLGAWVLRESCEQIAALSARLGRPLELSVNVSACQLRRPGFAQTVRQTILHTDFPVACLTLELTETALIGADAITHHELAELRRLGVGIVLDDFGTGCSSLSLLRRHIVHGIKIDREFVSSIPTDGISHAIVAGVVQMAQGIGCVVTAEGVETDAQRDALGHLGCERAQGFLLARPMEPDALLALALDPGRDR